MPPFATAQDELCSVVTPPSVAVPPSEEETGPASADAWRQRMQGFVKVVVPPSGEGIVFEQVVEVQTPFAV